MEQEWAAYSFDYSLVNLKLSGLTIILFSKIILLQLQIPFSLRLQVLGR